MTRFRKIERLCSRKVFQNLFHKGDSFYSYPFRVVFDIELQQQPQTTKFAVSVPKKKFKLAVHRNRIKRQVREAYRLNKSWFYDELNINIKVVNLVFIYTQSDFVEYKVIHSSVKTALARIVSQIQK